MRERMPSFDTHRYVKDLQQAGFNEIQAESIIRSLLESRDTDISHLATKEQVNVLKAQVGALDAKIDVVEQRLDAKIDSLGQRLDAKIDTLGQRLDARIDSLESKMATKEDLKSLEVKILESQNTMVKWMIGTVFALSGIILGAVKLFFH